jgi:homogentisate 1,2-dioxygenase
MPLYRSAGELPPRRHLALRGPTGDLRHEELIGNQGFKGPSSLLYHLRPPTAEHSMTEIGAVGAVRAPAGPLRRRHFPTSRVDGGGSPTLDRVPMLFNRDVSVLTVAPNRSDEHFWRNGDADEYLFVSEGEGVLESPFGDLAFGTGDQLIVPRGILVRFRLTSPSARMLVVLSRGWLRWPDRYHNRLGQLLEGAPFSERSIRTPADLRTHDEAGEFEVVTLKRESLTRTQVDHHPFDLVGWDGYYYPWAMSIHDFEPITGTVHLPPPVHQFLEGDGFVLCTFCPRPYDFHPEAVPAPYNHTNVGTDEVLFYASDQFMSRRGIERGSLTLHPDGVPHGPHPGRYEASIGQPGTEELAVMVDTFEPLWVSDRAAEVEDTDYPASWRA